MKKSKIISIGHFKASCSAIERVFHLWIFFLIFPFCRNSFGFYFIILYFTFRIQGKLNTLLTFLISESESNFYIEVASCFNALKTTRGDTIKSCRMKWKKFANLKNLSGWKYMFKSLKIVKMDRNIKVLLSTFLLLLSKSE